MVRVKFEGQSEAVSLYLFAGQLFDIYLLPR
jgi:hypothetical protein